MKFAQVISMLALAFMAVSATAATSSSGNADCAASKAANAHQNNAQTRKQVAALVAPSSQTTKPTPQSAKAVRGG